MVRAVEIAHAIAEALNLIDAYLAPDPPVVEVQRGPAAGTGDRGAAGRAVAPLRARCGRYRDDARIVPPTSQNQAGIEQDLRGFVQALIASR